MQWVSLYTNDPAGHEGGGPEPLGTTGAHCWGSVDAREGVDIPSTGHASHAMLRWLVA
jgi:hypothetical protein